jgi:hypothetical protein
MGSERVGERQRMGRITGLPRIVWYLLVGGYQQLENNNIRYDMISIH